MSPDPIGVLECSKRNFQLRQHTVVWSAFCLVKSPGNSYKSDFYIAITYILHFAYAPIRVISAATAGEHTHSISVCAGCRFASAPSSSQKAPKVRAIIEPIGLWNMRSGQSKLCRKAVINYIIKAELMIL